MTNEDCDHRAVSAVRQALAAAVGPPIGGLLVGAAGWRLAVEVQGAAVTGEDLRACQSITVRV
ncbi:hypothetical protein [Streptomyces sp. NPDC056291]|uniref:hypothetical protein n=1 Tax=Streptomyces sp. NPDC056291 TaxID=3345772 RepID=UPI0035E28975